MKSKGKPKFQIHVERNSLDVIGTKITVDLWIRVTKTKNNWKLKHIYYGVVTQGELLSDYTREDVVLAKVKDYVKRGRYHDYDFNILKST